ncbi:DUF975 family protein [Clostridium saccharobutylicum]|uniref:DUF975 family protein n=1 Tax=Clostridium saccharobutylicum TaxID=169679 RepID=A0A1S8NHZ2_CLOSA|nr:DUF975 family protein [Clostridium saccharobutylicum]OOM16116.1 hypothetical protein CLOSAC_03870 [Clostridium saccharobutylicum]
MISNSELKRQARDELKGRWGLAIGGFFIAIFFFPFIIDVINFFVDGSLPVKITKYIIMMMIRFLLIVGTLKFSLNYVTDGKTPFLDDIFSGFKVAIKALTIYVIMTICIILGLFLLIAPGIIVSLAFSQALYILVDDNSKSAIDCLKESVNMMKGHKKDCFILSLSFLGWFALMIIPALLLAYFPFPISLGLTYLLLAFIGLLVLIPYINVTFACFYINVKNSYNSTT